MDFIVPLVYTTQLSINMTIIDNFMVKLGVLTIYLARARFPNRNDLVFKVFLPTNTLLISK